MFLLDTNVVSELRKTRPHGAVVAWISAVPREQLFLPALVLGEFQSGIESLRARDASKADELNAWLDGIEAAFRILPMGGSIFRESARLMQGKSDQLVSDAMIAATARIHGFTVATRNVRDFKAFDVRVFNPFGG